MFKRPASPPPLPNGVRQEVCLLCVNGETGAEIVWIIFQRPLFWKGDAAGVTDDVNTIVIVLVSIKVNLLSIKETSEIKFYLETGSVLFYYDKQTDLYLAWTGPIHPIVSQKKSPKNTVSLAKLTS